MPRSTRHPLALSIAALLRSRCLLGSAVALASFGAQADCVTVGTTTTCTTAAPNPYVTRVGNGNIAIEDGRTVDVQAGAKLVVGDANAISLRDNATIHVGTGATVSATAVSAPGLFGAGGNTLEFRTGGTLTVDAGGEVLALGSQGSAEVINFQGAGNTILNSGTIRANNAVAIWSQNTTGLNTVINTETGIIQAPGTVIGGSGNGALDFTNRGQVIGNISLAGGNDILRLYTGSSITGNFSGGAGNDAIFLSGTGDSTLPGNFVGFESLTKNDAGKWTLTGTITGVTVATVAQGTLALTGNNANYTGPVIVDPAGVLEARAQSLPPGVTNNGLVRFTQPDDGSYAGSINGTGALDKTGAGTLTLTGLNSVGGASTLNGGTLVLGNTLETASLTMANATTLQINGTLQQQGGGVANVIGAGGAQSLIVNGRLTGSALLGDGDDLLDVSGVIVGSVDQGAGNDTTIMRPGGSIGGTLAQGLGNDRLQMLGGSIAGAVTQGAGADVLLMSGGTLASVDQGDDVDQLEISGGTITGTVQQGGGQDVFIMTGGTIGALLQGDGTDRFRMTGGQIIGGFDDGDYAEMTGGRIGRVNMKLENNTFDMSGGTIDGNLVTGFGNDTIILSEGYIGGNISVSGGDDSITITGGTVRGEIRASTGNDRLDWSGGGVVYGTVDMGEGNDVTTLSNLNNSHLGAIPLFTGGLGTDLLTMNNVNTTGVARFTGWEQINLRQSSQLTFDGDLVLSDFTTTGGTLDIDSTSTVFAGGLNANVRTFTAGQQVNVINAGRIDLSNGSSGPGDAFTVNGNYVGNNGGVYLQSVLAGDGAPSDRLVISNGVASGSTGLGILNAGGSGAATRADGILVVQSINGASTAPNAFALYNPIAAGAFEYFLFKGGVSAGSSENWYLRSTLVAGVTPAPAPAPPGVPTVTPPPPPPQDAGTPPPPLAPPPSPDVPENPDPLAPEPAPPPPPPEPSPVAPPQADAPPPVPTTPAAVPGPLAVPPTPGAVPAAGDIIPLYRVEAATYAVVPPLLRETSLLSLGTFHERQGEQRLLAGQGGFRAAWARMIGQSHEQHWEGDAKPSFDGDIQGIQAGVDLYATADDHARNQVGVFVGRTRAQGNVNGFAIGWDNVAVGRTRLDDKHVGLYWTRVGSAGGYLDAVVMQSRYDGNAWSARGLGIDLRGDGTTASMEVGKPLLQLGQSAWWLEPQAQVIWQRSALDDSADRISTVSYDNDNAWTGRVGLRLAADYNLAGNGWQPYLKVNYWQTFDGEDRINFGTNQLTNQQGARALEVGVGVVARFNANVSAFAVADYTRDLESSDQKERKSIEGNLGLRLDW
ncbi:autotransporter domain-containing protein [Stenotrophomonas sp.]|uniref:autotransporter family protein n=1 Tax=Stenotrophomonas sp. TaxID=69392 RepID=UPI0025F6D711|nr:autotransporter domain-containing protein [Stenotrophomonas sp.]MBW8375671.1 autotransporter domain-containing protein [Stenotrophomonas sp.]